MAQDYSFDVVSKIDMQALQDAVHIAGKEVANRYDFKGSGAEIELVQEKDQAELRLKAANEHQVKALFEVFQQRAAKRGVPLKNIEPGKIEPSLAGSSKMSAKVQQGIPSEKGKQISALLKKSGLKAQAQIQGDQVRVVSRSKDVLQEAISRLKEEDFGLDLQFTNYR